MLDESPGILKPGMLPNCDEPSCKLNTATPNGQFLLIVSHRPGVGKIWRYPQAPYSSFMAACVRSHLNGIRRSRKGRPPRTRGSLQAFGAGLDGLR